MFPTFGLTVLTYLCARDLTKVYALQNNILYSNILKCLCTIWSIFSTAVSQMLALGEGLPLWERRWGDSLWPRTALWRRTQLWATSRQLPAAGLGSVPQQGTDAAPALLLNLCFYLLFSLVFIGIISSELSSSLLTMLSVILMWFLSSSLNFKF